MSNNGGSFKVGIEFRSVLSAISKQIYETPLAFLRENVQNAVDATRIQAYREGIPPENKKFQINVDVKGDVITVQDSGVGMTRADLESFFWTIGASGKRTSEALAAGCVGMFGIGGFANFGVCDQLEVISQTADEDIGTRTALSEAEIADAGIGIPSVTVEQSDRAAPRGTLVIGHLRSPPNIVDLNRYIRDFVKFVPIAVYFNGEKVSQIPFANPEGQDNLTPISETKEWQAKNISFIGQFFEDLAFTLSIRIDSLKINGEDSNLTGYVKFQNGPIDVFKRGFKLCATQVGSYIGVSGRLDSDLFIPTAGRDSLEAKTTATLAQIAQALELTAICKVLESTSRINQHTRIFRYILQHNLVEKIQLARVNLADGNETTLAEIQKKSEIGGVGVFYGLAQKQALNQIMQARGHIVVLMSSDRFRREAEQNYLQRYCKASPFDGMIECSEEYGELTRFEKVFLSELELNISKSYEIKNFKLIGGKLTEDIPVFVKEFSGSREPHIYIDVRHNEITKLEELGYTQILYSLIAAFCREYLGPSLKKWSPRFFGNGALNLELLAKRRSELWILMKDDIGVVKKGGQRQVVNKTDIRVVNAAEANTNNPPDETKPARIIQIIGHQGDINLNGYYIRLPDAAFRAYGDLIPECDSRGGVWIGNKIQYIASDTVSAAFQFEIRLDEVVTVDQGTEGPRAEGVFQLEKPFQEIYGGLYFPIPTELERFLVPSDSGEIRLELHCDWMDMRTAKNWEAKE